MRRWCGARAAWFFSFSHLLSSSLLFFFFLWNCSFLFFFGFVSGQSMVVWPNWVCVLGMVEFGGIEWFEGIGRGDLNCMVMGRFGCELQLPWL